MTPSTLTTPTTPTRTGLTLIEVVAAAALLTLIVVACLPLITGARRDLQAVNAVALVSSQELSEAVDELLRQKPSLARELIEQPEGLELRWTVREREYQATVQLATRVEGDERRSAHAWAVFLVGGVEIPRWLRLPDPPPERSP
ncbi:MAG: hypothetical protein ACF8R9_11910 [Phycisphaerales bacterium JB054]